MLTDDILAEVLTQLRGIGATVTSERDDYGNPDISVQGSGQYPVVARHSVIGGEEIVAIDASGKYHRVPAPGGDPFGPIDDVPEEIERLWKLVVAQFPDAAV
ncbi:hypothetical protein H7J07_05235 [Mycobacterium koreense]|uniref:Uncharacterized protein n=1 Tax=Mycolicibacillus koreensis TaxID=1069220 RepID=A0A7I7SB34_9MYCO|nr:hypothetical protein [Mycolicibacillus koreensis]MCV7247628.1 hypothetical protein [Mycolicibacillus koreensis]OSC32797.1 hypothetical protein B8W67_13670 [Mycolicibacillus koreensis]BBY54008.1 hypothetical protein MKOR_12590 [Mycolicibacillus koreensis]